MATNGIKVNMTPSHPGDFIRTEVIEEFGLNVTKASQILGVRRATLSALLNGNAALSPEMALRIEKAFNVSMDMLLRMQALVRRRADACAGKRGPCPALRSCLTGNALWHPCISSVISSRRGRH